MLQEAILSLYLFIQPTPHFNPVQSINMIEEMKNTMEINKVVEAVKMDEKEEIKLHIKQVAQARKSAVKKKEYKWMTFNVSAYTNGYESTRKRKGNKDYGRTTSGRITKEGRTVSADPKVLPIGTVIFIEGAGERIVEDTGSAIKGFKLDLFIEDLQRAKKFGRKNMRVRIIKMGKGRIE